MRLFNFLVIIYLIVFSFLRFLRFRWLFLNSLVLFGFCLILDVNRRLCGLFFFLFDFLFSLSFLLVLDRLLRFFDNTVFKFFVFFVHI